MTGESLEEGEAFKKSVMDCMEDLNGLLPGLSLRYEVPVIIGAMAEHVGSAIWALRHQKVCDTHQANLAIQHLEFAAFPDEHAPPPSSTP